MAETDHGTATYLGEAEGAYVDSDGEAGFWWSRDAQRRFRNKLDQWLCWLSEADPARDDRGFYTYTTIDDLRTINGTRGSYTCERRVFWEGNIHKTEAFDGT